MGDSDLDTPTLFAQDSSQHLKCPVCQKLYRDPVINIICGHTFCKTCVQSADTCPIDNSTCDTSQVVINRLVIGQIDDLLIYCRYGLVKENDVYIPDPSGCQQKIHLGARNDHEKNCEFKTVTCVNNSCSARLRQSELEEHLKICVYNTCQYNDKGCEYQDRREEVEDHELTCGYRGLQTPAGSGAMETRAQELEDTNRQLQNQVNTLTTRVKQMEDINSGLQDQLKECLGTVSDLQQKYDNLSSTVEQLMSIRNRRSLGSPAPLTEGRPRSASSSFRRSFSGSPPSTGKYNKWAMPFQFKCIGTLRGHQDVVWCMAARNKRLYTAGADCLIKVWDLENLQRGLIKTMKGHTNAIQCMVLSGNCLYTGGHDNSVCCWNLDDYSMVKCVQNAHDNIISAMVIVGDYLFTSSFSLIKIWDAKNLTMISTLTGLHHWVRALALNPERDKLYSGSHNSINIWSVTEPFGLKGKLDHTFGSVHSLAITEKHIIAGTYNRNVHVFRVNTYEHITALKGHIGIVTSVVASYCGGFCMSSSSDQTIKVTITRARTEMASQIWNLENMLPTQTLQRHEGSVNTLVLYNDLLFSGSEDKEIKVFMYFQMQMGFALKP